MEKITVADELRGKLKLAVLVFNGLNCRLTDRDLWSELEQLGEFYRDRFKAPAEATELLAPARKLYRSIGIDPTKNRPSSEALLRRSIQNKELYQINSIVDICNLCSLKFLLPIGLYDIEKIAGQVILRQGQAGEEYPGIRKQNINVEGRYTLVDDTGPFGNPSADSLRTAIEEGANKVLMVIFAAQDYPLSSLEKHSQFAEEKMLQYHNGEKGESYFI